MFEIKMPQAGQTMEEGTIVQWLKAVGEKVERNEAIAEIETDKAVFEFESPEAGVLLKILQPEGATVPVFTPIALVGEAHEDVTKYSAAGGEGSGGGVQGGGAQAKRPEAPGPAAPSAAKPGAPVNASPAARKMAGELGVDLSSISGTGPGGRITEADVQKTHTTKAAAAPARAGGPVPGGPVPGGPVPGGPGEPVRREMSRMRKTIAANLQLSKQTIPHFYVRLTVDAAALVAFAAAAKRKFPCSINIVVVFACSRAMMEFPQFRSRLEGGGTSEFPAANIGIAVAVDDGLVVPAVVGADGMTLQVLAGKIRSIVSAARAGRLEGVGRATFTITNLGMCGVEEFAAIINPGEPAILAVGAVREAPVAVRGEVRAGQVMTVTLSADHRIIDGVVAARFLARLKELLERPETIS
jgi:pyruvate dehydrogenase E2 component (dihydrolipoamide acetyltransferase)